MFTGAKNDVVNPKINNMLQGYDSVKYDLLWMTDANIMSQFCTGPTSVEYLV